MNKPKEILELEKIYGISLRQIAESEDIFNGGPNRNCYQLNSNNEIIGLSFSVNPFNFKEIKGFEKLIHLKRLDLYECAITEIRGFDNLKQLQELVLSHNQITELKGLDNLKQLRRLCLDSNQIAEIKGLDGLTKLEILELSRNQITEIKGLERLTQLAYLWLEYNQITEIKGLENLIQLIRLRLFKNQITEIKGLENLEQLRYLDLGVNKITEIKGLDNQRLLLELNLVNNQITGIKGLTNLTQLEELNLAVNQITSIEPESLEKIIESLDSLKLYYNKISEPRLREEEDNLNQVKKWLSEKNLKQKEFKLPSMVNDSYSVDDYIQMSMSYCVDDKYDEAFYYITRAIELDPNNGELWYVKGNILHYFEDYDDAIECFNKAIKHGMNPILCLKHKAQSLINAEEFELAIECYDKAIQLDYNDVESWSYKGLTFAMMKRFHEALECCDKAVKLAPDDFQFQEYRKQVQREFEEDIEISKWSFEENETKKWKCGDNVTAKLSGDTITITGEGEMYDFEGNVNYLQPMYDSGYIAPEGFAPWGIYQFDIKTVIIEKGITHIGRLSFWRCENLSSLEIPNTVGSIGKGAFCGSDLSYVKIPPSVKRIEEDAFVGPYLNIEFSGNLEYIGRGAFENNAWLRALPDHIVYVDKVLYQYKYEFLKDRKLFEPNYCNSNVEVKEGTLSISNGAFEGCENLTSIVIPESVLKIGANAFENCENLENVTIRNKSIEVGEKAFYNTKWIEKTETIREYYNFQWICNNMPDYQKIKNSSIKFDDGIMVVENGGKYGFINEAEKLVIPCIYDSFDKYKIGFHNGVYCFFEGYASVKLDNKWGFIDKTGKRITSFKYDEVAGFRGERAAVIVGARDNHKLGFIDQTGEEIIPLKYNVATFPPCFSEGVVGVRMNGKCGFIDKNDNIIIPFKYDYVIYNNDSGFIQVQLNEKWGILDTTGKIIISVKYDTVDDFYDGLARVRINNKWGFVDLNGNEVIPIQYDDTGHFSLNKNGCVDVTINEKRALVDKTGKELTSFKYDYIRYFEHGLAEVRINGKYGFIDQTGKEIFAPIFDEVKDLKQFDNSQFIGTVAYLDGKPYYINNNGGVFVLNFKFDNKEHFEKAKSHLIDRLGVDNFGKSIHGGEYGLNVYDNCNDIEFAETICKELGATECLNVFFTKGAYFAKIGKYEEAVQYYLKSEYDVFSAFISLLCRSDYDIKKCIEVQKQLLPYMDKLLQKDDFFNSIIKDVKGDIDAYKQIYIKSILIISLLYVDFEFKTEHSIATYTTLKTARLLITGSSLRLYLYPQREEQTSSDDTKEGQTLLDYFYKENRERESTEKIGAFVTCFTFNVEHFNQFRLYGKTNNIEHTGVSIILKSDFFQTIPPKLAINATSTKHSDSENDRLSLFRCVYLDPRTGFVASIGQREEYDFHYDNNYIDDIFGYADPEGRTGEEKRSEAYKNKMEAILREIRNQFKELKDLSKNSDPKIVNSLLLFLRFLTKDVQFKEEQECRIIKVSPHSNSKNDDYNRKYQNYFAINDYIKDMVFGKNAKTIKEEYDYIVNSPHYKKEHRNRFKDDLDKLCQDLEE